MKIDVEKLSGRVNLLPHRMLLEGDPIAFEAAPQARGHALVEVLFDLPDVDKIIVGQDYVSLFHDKSLDPEGLVLAATTALASQLPPLDERQGGNGLLPLLAFDAGVLVYLAL